MILATALAAAALFSGAADMAELPGGWFRVPFRPVTPAKAPDSIRVRSYKLDKAPVSNRDFAAFLAAHPDYAKDRIKPMFADSAYLATWPAGKPSADRRDDPVTEVSWFAAQAYCEARDKRLPTTAEWELAARARPQGTDSAAYARAILDWYARPTGEGPPRTQAKGGGFVNAYGVKDLHGRIWEWTEDFNAGGPAKASVNPKSAETFFCGGAGQAAVDGMDYASFMRYSFRASLDARFSVSSLGFRCAK